MSTGHMPCLSYEKGEASPKTYQLANIATGNALGVYTPCVS